ncbi:phenylalanine aminomutase (D-beta-phenylalanine forming) [Mycetohabitans sp. B5]|uniref:Histidine ammonia-lyase n=1 Tax=Mycetohabitans endofungorum TaxID=417203 RepID=A0A2P5K7A4_9BURK|nr:MULTISPECIES: phenylalanine aminomutase (D-beta-phenylalanine forming) [Mycetohabitans]MCG1056027.1 phenylalanine aminomutase (D-beta-phenylalanine forming) [Mycetohabitans sp. B5]PPB81941.1 histidine ammonia-lyase [Mycetohabitans endofungorum]
MSNILEISGAGLRMVDIARAAYDFNVNVSLGQEACESIIRSRRLLDDLILQGKVIYGVNTSMGGFVKYLIPEKYAAEMQENLIAAVATNVGSYFDDHVVRATMLARINSLARGVSAISLENLQKFVDIFNKGICPCIPQKGSLGTSGDLGPLAAIALALTGKWKVRYRGEVMDASDALRDANIEPLKLSYKEGLALINGTSAMTGLACLLVNDAEKLIESYESVTALTLEALQGKRKVFSPLVHEEKLHPGQRASATNIYNMLSGSGMISNEDDISKELRSQLSDDVIDGVDNQIEDAYSLRCTPHILGPIKDAVDYVKSVVENELNSSSDNPLVIPKCGDVYHNGHFHGQYMSMAMDHLSIALVTLSNLSDRRIDRFMDKNNSNGLPPFLCENDQGIRLGLMGGQFMSASLASENRSLCVPVSIQSLPSTADFQDIVSLGLVAARRAREILDNTIYVISFELLCACQAADIRGAEKLGAHTATIYNALRSFLPFFDKDEPLTPYLEDVANFIRNGMVCPSGMTNEHAI